MALTDSGERAIIGSLSYSEGAILNNPIMLVMTFILSEEEYLPVVIHGIVNSFEVRATAKNLPVVFHHRTSYLFRDGSELYILVVCGSNVSCNFIISNVWLKATSAVLDFGSEELCVPLFEDVHKFPLAYCTSQKTVPSPPPTFLINDDAPCFGKAFPSRIHVMDRHNKYHWSVDGNTWHNKVCVLGTFRACKYQLRMRRLGNMDLVVARNGIYWPFLSRASTIHADSCITAENRHGNNFSH